CASVLRERSLDGGTLGFRDTCDRDVLIRRQRDHARMDAGDLTQPGHQLVARTTRDTPVLDEERVVPPPVESLVPPIAVRRALQRELASRLEREARALRELGPEPIEPAIFDRVLEPSVRPVLAIAVVALNEHRVLGDGNDLFG